MREISGRKGWKQAEHVSNDASRREKVVYLTPDQVLSAQKKFSTMTEQGPLEIAGVHLLTFLSPSLPVLIPAPTCLGHVTKTLS